jgi:hypothetical protein
MSTIKLHEVVVYQAAVQLVELMISLLANQANVVRSVMQLVVRLRVDIC